MQDCTGCDSCDSLTEEERQEQGAYCIEIARMIQEQEETNE